MNQEPESDTPECDLNEFISHLIPDLLVVNVDLANKLERERNEARRWVEEGKINGARCAQERDDLLQAISDFKKAKGRFNTQLAAERLIAMLPEFYQ
jgi:cell division FtsZ-interacting protein ZapD